MTVATDPKIDQIEDSDDEFAKHFNEFAGKEPPSSEAQGEGGEPEGNDPEGEPAAPAKGEPKAATDEGKPTETVTSGSAEPDGGGQPPSEQAPDDPFADLPQDVRDKIAAIEKERDEARHKAQSDANRVSALSRKLQQLTAQPPASAPAPAEDKTEAQKALDDKIEQLRKDYGDIADPLIELIEQQSKELSSVRTVLTGLSEERQAQVIEAETQALEARHPDWRDIAQSQDFAAWLQVQPPNIQGLAQSWDARETSVVLTLFKAEKVEATGQGDQKPPVAKETKPDAATGERRSQQLDGGRDVRSRPAPAASEPPEDFEAAFEFYRQKREQKMAAQRR